jgi:hypothetical protein
MPRQKSRQLSVVMARWDHGWALYVLDPDDGLLGQLRTTKKSDALAAVRRFIAEHHPHRSRDSITFVER